MPIFAFYDFKIGQRKDEEADMFKEQEKEDNIQLKQYDSPEACFGSFFKTGGKLSLNVLREKGKCKEKTVEWEPFENDVLMVADGVILMTIEKFRHITLEPHKMSGFIQKTVLGFGSTDKLSGLCICHLISYRDHDSVKRADGDTDFYIIAEGAWMLVFTSDGSYISD